MIRLILIVIYLFLFFLFGIFMNIFLFIACGKDDKKRYQYSHTIIHYAFNIVLFLAGAKKHVKGVENVPDSSALYVSNHRSYFDIMVTQTSIGKPLGFIAKKEMIKIPFLSKWMKNIGCLFLDRKDTRAAIKTIQEGARRLKENECSIYIFPEGTRSHGEGMGTFKKGSFKIAEKANAPIVPIAISKSDEVFENNPWFWKIKSHDVYITIGEPVYPDKLDKEDKKHIDRYVQDMVESMLREQHK